MEKITKGYPNWDIPLNNNIQEYNDTIGTEEMGTIATTIKGAIKELKNSIDTNKTDLSDKVQTNTADISNLKTKNTEITTQLNDCVKKDNIINNCSTTEEGFALDARQGKILSDTINDIVLKSIVVKPNGNNYVDIDIPEISLGCFVMAMNGDVQTSDFYIIGTTVTDGNVRVHLNKNVTTVRINLIYTKTKRI